MNGEKLYRQVKTGEIDKTKLTDIQKGELYKYMIESNKISQNQIKPESLKKYNLIESPKNTLFDTTSNISTYTPSRSPDTNTPISPIYAQPKTSDKLNPLTTTTAPINYKTSTSPEMALVDVLSNLSMPQKEETVPSIQRNLGAVNKSSEREKPYPISWGQTPVRAVAENVRAGWNQFGRVLPNTIDMLLGDKNIKLVDDYLEDQRKQQQEEAEKLAKINVTPTQQFAGSVAQGVGQSAPYALEGVLMAPYFAAQQAGQMLTAGGTQLMQGIQSMLSPSLSQKAQQSFVEAVTNPNFILSALQSAGSIFQESINKGATRKQAINAAITGGIPSGLVEVMGGAENLGQELAKKQPWTRQAFESGMSEALEEIVQYVFENASKKIAFDKDMPLFSTTEEAVINPNEQAYEGASAFFSSAIMGGTGSALNTVLDKLSNNQQQTEEVKASEISSQSQPTMAEIDSLIDLLDRVKEQLPELSEFADDNIGQLNEYKNQVVQAELSNENAQIDPSIEEGAKVPTIEDTGVTEDIKDIDTLEEIKTQAMAQSESSIIDSNALTSTTDSIIQNDASKQEKNDFNELVDVELFENQLNDWVAGKFDKKNHLIVLNNTPEVYQELGAKDLPITVTSRKLERIVNESGNQKREYHGLGIDIVKQLPNALKDPLNVLKSHNNSFVAVTSLFDSKGNPIIASLLIDGVGKIENISVSANIMTSLYGKDNFENYINRNKEAGNVIYPQQEPSENSIEKSDTRPRLQLPSADIAHKGSELPLFKDNIPQNKDVVNGENQSTSKRLRQDFNIPDNKINEATTLTEKISQEIAENHTIDTEALTGLTGIISESHPELTSTEIENGLYDVFMDVAEISEIQQTKEVDNVPSQFIGETPQSEKDKVLGIIPPGMNIEPTPITDKFSYDTPELERQYKNNRITKQSRVDKIKNTASEFKKAATRTFRELDPKLSENAEILKELIRYPKIKQIASDEAQRILLDITGREGDKLSMEEYSRFERYLFLSDLMEEIELGHELPGLWTEDSVKSNHTRLEQSLTPNIREAIQRRKDHLNKAIEDYTKAMGDIGHDVSGRFTKENYFRHQVLEYATAKRIAGSGDKVKVNTNRGFTKERLGTDKAINESYLQTEYEVLATMLYDKEVAQMLKRIDDNYGIKKQLKKQAKAENQAIKEQNEKLPEGAEKEERVTWKDFIPEDYTVWQPIQGKHMFTVNTIAEDVAYQIIQQTVDELATKDIKVGKALALGLDKEQFVIPDRVAKSLDNTYNKMNKRDDVIHQILSLPLSIWKPWVLTVNPRQVFKYNLRNVTGDIDGLFAAAGIKAFNPEYVKRSSKELYNAMRYGRFSKDLLEFRDRGGYSDLMFVQELGEINETKNFEIYNQNDTNSIIRSAIKKMPILSTYTNFTENATNYREGILRYSAYLYYKENIKKNNGRPTHYGASTRERIDGLKTIEDKAYQLSKDALGSYDEITEVGQALRKYLIPLHAWNEVNMKRYKRVFENTIGDIKEQHELGKKVKSGLGLAGYMSVKSTIALGKVFTRVAFVSALLMAWNRLRFPDEDDQLPNDVKSEPHLTLGKDEHGNIIYFSRLGALNDVLDWFGLDKIWYDVNDIINERKTLKDQAEDVFWAPINKLINSVSPFIKTPVELLSGSSYYPDARQPSTIRDRNYYLFNSFGLGEEYRLFAGLPRQTSYAKSWEKALIYKSSPEANAYYKALELKYKFQEKVLKKEAGRMLGGDEKSQALYYYKQALKYGDDKVAKKYFKKYFELGGTKEGLKQGLSSLNPLYGLVESRDERKRFIAWLSEGEREILGIAMKYYNDLISPAGE